MQCCSARAAVHEALSGTNLKCRFSRIPALSVLRSDTLAARADRQSPDRREATARESSASARS